MTTRIPDPGPGYEPQPLEVIDELFAYMRDANRIAREGGSVAEREALHARRAALLARIEADEQEHVTRSAQRARAAYCTAHTHCPDWPLCGHDDEQGQP